MFEEIKEGSTRFNIGVDQICATCHNARLIKVSMLYYVGPLLIVGQVNALKWLYIVN